MLLVWLLCSVVGVLSVMCVSSCKCWYAPCSDSECGGLCSMLMLVRC